MAQVNNDSITNPNKHTKPFAVGAPIPGNGLAAQSTTGVFVRLEQNGASPDDFQQADLDGAGSNNATWHLTYQPSAKSENFRRPNFAVYFLKGEGPSNNEKVPITIN